MIPPWNPNTSFEVSQYILFSPKIRKELRFVMISDLHNCEYGRGNCRLLAVIQEIAPAAVLIAGDLIEASPRADEGPAMALLYELSKRFPVYYGVGNHEKRVFLRKSLLAQRDQLVYGLQKAGVKLIHNRRYELPGTGVEILGLDLPKDYYHRGKHHPIPPDKMKEYLGQRREGHYHIMLAHDPLHFPEYLAFGPELILSGHVHGGIVRLPGGVGLISPEYKLFPKYSAGLYRAGDTRMIVSRGLGSHTINLRVGNPPELPVICLKPMPCR
ncbi:MAG: metallophosphoesterase [Lachnospiraceae bacterium]|nr:metallophosphoesterase [Lachnospiraceae bacterium]